MNSNLISVNIQDLQIEIDAFKKHSVYWLRHCSWWKNTLLLASIGCAASATIAGIVEEGHVAAAFSAIGGAIIAAQNSFRFREGHIFYGAAITECDRLSRILRLQTSSASDFDGVVDALNTLRKREDITRSGSEEGLVKAAK